MPMRASGVRIVFFRMAARLAVSVARMPFRLGNSLIQLNICVCACEYILIYTEVFLVMATGSLAENWKNI